MMFKLLHKGIYAAMEFIIFLSTCFPSDLIFISFSTEPSMVFVYITENIY